MVVEEVGHSWLALFDFLELAVILALLLFGDMMVILVLQVD